MIDPNTRIAKLKADIADGQVVIITGTGVSVAACSNQEIDGHKIATWRGLLEHGAHALKAKNAATDNAVEVLLAQIKSGETDLMITAAETIGKRMQDISKGTFRSWLKDTIGQLTIQDRSVLDAIGALPGLLATLNYDNLLAEATCRKPITWKNADAVQDTMQNNQTGVLHLHGHFSDPDSIVLGVSSYNHVKDDPHAESVLRVFTIGRTLMFIGCGATMEDPNFSQLIAWGKQALADVSPRHVVLCRTSEVQGFQAKLVEAPWLQPLAYGEGYEDLVPFLRKLAPEAIELQPVLTAKEQYHNISKPDRLYYSKSGPPTFLQAYCPDTFSTRENLSSHLAEQLKDSSKKLFLVASPFGWGKTTLIAKALEIARQAVYVVNLETRESRDSIIEAVLTPVRISEDERDRIDTDPTYFTSILGKVLPKPSATIIAFVAASTNESNRLPPSLISVIEDLIKSGYRCLIEMHDIRDWRSTLCSIRQKHEIDFNAFPCLDRNEVHEWICLYGLDPKLREHLDLLEGHPLMIRYILEKVKKEQEYGFTITPDTILDEACRFIDEPEVRNYFGHRLESRQELPEYVIEWFGLLWPAPLQTSNPSFKPEWEEQLRLGVYLGLISYDSAHGFRPTAWLHLFCFNRLRERLHDAGVLNVSASQLTGVDQQTINQVKRRLLELVRRQPTQCGFIIRLYDSLAHSDVLDIHELTRYTAVIPSSDLNLIIENTTSPRTVISSLLDGARQSNAITAAKCWSSLCNDTCRLAQVLTNDWTALKELAQAFKVSDQQSLLPDGIRDSIWRTVQEVRSGGHGHDYFLSRIGIYLCRSFIYSDQADLALMALQFSISYFAKLKVPAYDDFRYKGWHSLEFDLAELRYSLASSIENQRVCRDELRKCINRGLIASKSSADWNEKVAVYAADVCTRWSTRFPALDSSIYRLHERLGSPGISISSLYDYGIGLQSIRGNTGEGESILTTTQHQSNSISDLTQPQGHQLSLLYQTFTRLLSGSAKVSAKKEWNKASQFIKSIQSDFDLFLVTCGCISSDSRAIDMAAVLLEDLSKHKIAPADFSPHCLARMVATLMRNIAYMRSLDSSDVRAKLTKHLLKLPNLVFISVSDNLSINEKTEFWICCLHFFVSYYRVSLSSFRAEKVDLSRTTLNLGDKIDSLFTYLMNASMRFDDSIYILRYNYESLRHQVSMALYRRGPCNLEPPSLDRLASSILDFTKYLPNSYSSLFYSATYQKYLWQWRKASALADSALLRARSISQKERALLFIVDLLIPIIFTPAILASKYSDTPSPSDTDSLCSAIDQLIKIDGKYSKLLPFKDAAQYTGQEWVDLVSSVDKRIGELDQYWMNASRDPVLADDDVPFLEVLSDLTDHKQMELLAILFKWATFKDSIDQTLQQNLSLAAVRSAWAAYRWQAGSYGSTISCDYTIATSVSLAIIVSGVPDLFDSIQSPFKSRKGVHLTWCQAATSRLDSLKSRSVGNFARHMGIISERLKSRLSSVCLGA